MKYLFFVSGESLELAKAEIRAVFNIKNVKSISRILILDLNKNYVKNLQRLAYTKKVYRLLFNCKISLLEKNLERFNWNSIYKENFCLRLHYLDKKYEFSEAKLAGYIWRGVKTPNVNLENPKTLIEIFFIKGKAYCGILLYEQKESFDQRKAHKRPALHPVSLHPKLARCLVNLSGAKKGELIVDPFCGTGGILIEVGLIGCKTIGYDIDKKILEKCRKNLEHFKIESYKLINSDATKIKKRYDYIVTDLPYGKSTKKFDVEKLYKDFLINLKKILKKKAVVVFPDFVDYEKLIRLAKLKIVEEYSYYIHKTMSKRIVVINKNFTQ